MQNCDLSSTSISHGPHLSPCPLAWNRVTEWDRKKKDGRSTTTLLLFLASFFSLLCCLISNPQSKTMRRKQVSGEEKRKHLWIRNMGWTSFLLALKKGQQRHQESSLPICHCLFLVCSREQGKGVAGHHHSLALPQLWWDSHHCYRVSSVHLPSDPPHFSSSRVHIVLLRRRWGYWDILHRDQLCLWIYKMATDRYAPSM